MTSREYYQIAKILRDCYEEAGPRQKRIVWVVAGSLGSELYCGKPSHDFKEFLDIVLGKRNNPNERLPGPVNE